MWAHKVNESLMVMMMMRVHSEGSYGPPSNQICVGGVGFATKVTDPAIVTAHRSHFFLFYKFHLILGSSTVKRTDRAQRFEIKIPFRLKNIKLVGLSRKLWEGPNSEIKLKNGFTIRSLWPVTDCLWINFQIFSDIVYMWGNSGVFVQD